MLGDPTYFPVEFRRWLQDFLQNSDFKINKSQIIGGGAAGGSDATTLLPAGMIIPYATLVIGKDTLPCDGTAVSRTDYKELFQSIGVTWGAGDGSTTFNVPDLQDRALFGKGSVISVGMTDGLSLGGRGGPHHYHMVVGNTEAAGAHHHQFSAMQEQYMGLGGTVGGSVEGAQQTENTNDAPDHTHPFSAPTTGGYGLDGPSFAGVQYAITTGRSPVATPAA